MYKISFIFFFFFVWICSPAGHKQKKLGRDNPLLTYRITIIWKTDDVSRFYGFPSAPALGLADLHHVEAKTGKMCQVQDGSRFGGFIWNYTQLHRVSMTSICKC